MTDSDLYPKASEAFSSSPAPNLGGLFEKEARVKVLDPLTSTGPSMNAELISSSKTDLRVRVPRCIYPGSSVQVRTSEEIAFGVVRSCVTAGAEYEILVALHGRL
jgi:hypothetical protein